MPQDPHSVALRLLSQRDYSSEGLRIALERRFPQQENLTGIIRHLEERGFLNDRRFATHSASFLLEHRGFGPYRIRRELKLRKVPPELIEDAVRQVFEGVDEREWVERAIEKKLRSAKRPLTRRRAESVCRSLMRQGFSVDVIMKTVRASHELAEVLKGSTGELSEGSCEDDE